MSRKIAKNLPSFFKNPLRQGQYSVLPPPTVPPHIAKPDYVLSANPKFGEYELPPLIHGEQGIEDMRKAAGVVSRALEATKEWLVGQGKRRQVVRQEDIDRFVFQKIVGEGAYPTPIGFMHFPKSVCVSVNECIVHGIPTTRPLQWGDKINIDITAYIAGHHGDNNLTLFYGQPEEEVKLRVLECAQQALYESIALCGPGVPFNQIGRTVERVVGSWGMHSCSHFSGHGIGPLLHMPPMVYHRYYPQFKQVMQVGQTFTIEPIVSLLPAEQLQVWKDNFTTISPNNPNAQFEHTILIVEDGCQVLTKRPSENIPNPNRNIKNL